MTKKKNSTPQRKLSINKLKLLLITVGLVVITVVSFILSIFYHVFPYFLGVFLITVCSMIYSCIAAGNYNPGKIKMTFWKLLKGNITLIKYSQKFPLYFYFDPGPRNFRYKDAERVIETMVKPGDILLRRYDTYIDGMVLQQASYFTHCAIYYGESPEDHPSQKYMIIQAIGMLGVSWVDVDTFCKCDDVAILRFREDLFNKLPVNESINNASMNEISLKIDLREPIEKNSVFSNVNSQITVKDVAMLIKEDTAALREKELSVFNTLEDCINSKVSYADKENYQTVMQIVLDEAKSRLGFQYDYMFSFVDSKRMSCIELAWSSYKCLFPIHQIVEERFTFFSIINTLIIVPDSVIRSEAFELVYCSIPSIGTNRAKLARYVASHTFRVWLFMAEFLVLQFALTAILWFIFNHIWAT